MSYFCLLLRLPPIVARVSFALVPGTRLLLYLFLDSPNTNPTLKTTPIVNRLYQHLISNQILYHNPNTTRHHIVIISPSVSCSCNIILLTHSCFRVSLGVGFVFDRDNSGFRVHRPILTHIIVLFDGPLLAICGSSYIFCFAQRSRKGRFNVIGRAATVFALFSRLISYRQNAS